MKLMSQIDLEVHTSGLVVVFIFSVLQHVL